MKNHHHCFVIKYCSNKSFMAQKISIFNKNNVESTVNPSTPSFTFKDKKVVIYWSLNMNILKQNSAAMTTAFSNDVKPLHSYVLCRFQSSVWIVSTHVKWIVNIMRNTRRSTYIQDVIFEMLWMCIYMNDKYHKMGLFMWSFKLLNYIFDENGKMIRICAN